MYLNDSHPPQGFLGEEQDKIFNFLSYSPLRRLALTHYVRQAYVALQYKRGQTYSKRFTWIDRYNSRKWIDDLKEFRQTVIEAQFDWGAAWDSSFENIVYPALGEIKDIFEKKGAKFAVALFPVSPQVYTNLTDPFIDYPQRQLSMFTNKASIPLFDLLPDLKVHKNLRLFADHAHLNREGNRIVAAVIYPFLKDLLEKKTDERTH